MLIKLSEVRIIYLVTNCPREELSVTVEKSEKKKKNVQIFAQFKKKQYFCSRKSPEGFLMLCVVRKISN